MHDGKTGPPDPGLPVGLLGDPDDQLLDVFGRIPEHTRAARIGIDIAGAIDRLRGPVRIAAATLEVCDHARQPLATEARLRVEDGAQRGELFPFDLGQQLFDDEFLTLDGEVGVPVARLDDIAGRQPGIVGGNALGERGCRQESRQEDMCDPRPQRCLSGFRWV